MLIDHSNRSYLVTGAGSGIGRACARTLAESDAFVWVNDLNSDAALGVAREIKANGGKAEALAGDVANPQSWAEKILIRGPLHGVVHCAGYDVSTPVESADMADFERLVSVMVTGPFEMTQRLLPALTKADGACVLFIASVHALATEPGISAYAACKAAQIGMIRSMAQDLGPKRIRALAVSPGYIHTPLLEKFFSGEPDPDAARIHAASLHPLGRIGCPDDIAGMVNYLMSPLAEFVNGVNIVVDGGLTAQLAH